MEFEIQNLMLLNYCFQRNDSIIKFFICMLYSKIYQNINGMTAGPVTISEDTVTIPSGSTWSII